jgi:hypothetical protein
LSEFSDRADANEEIAELRAALKRAQIAEARAIRKTEELVQAVYMAARDASIATQKVKVVAPPKDKRKGKEEVALIHTTDWQLGKKTVSYGMNTCSDRIDEFTRKVLEITDIQRAHHPVRKAVLLVGGDICEGVGIFPQQVYEVEAYLYDQLFEASRILNGMIRSLAEHFESVHVVCEFGNHGRLGRKGEMPYGDNIDRMIYRVTQERTSDVKNVTWQMSEAWYQIFTIGNYRGLLVHGDEIKSFGGNTPAFGILRKVNQWASGVLEPFQDAFLGHFHTPMTLTLANGGRIHVTGSPESSNEYAREFMAATGKPSQRLHFVDPEKGRTTAEYNVWLT